MHEIVLLLNVVIIVCAMVVKVVSDSPWRQQYVELFEESNRGGKSYGLYTFHWFLADFDNLASSFCVHKGIAILYTEQSFTSGSSIWAYSNGYTCFDMDSFFDKKISSVRFAGFGHLERSNLDWYEQEGFMGEAGGCFTNAETKGCATPNISYAISSVIVSGADPWTLYEEPNYEGAAVCIYPKSNLVPGFYPYQSSLGRFGGKKLGSVKEGCHVNDTHYFHASRDSGNGTKYLTGSYYNVPYLHNG